MCPRLFSLSSIKRVNKSCYKDVEYASLSNIGLSDWAGNLESALGLFRLSRFILVDFFVNNFFFYFNKALFI